MALGFSFGGGDGGNDIIPIVKFDCRAGRMFRRDRVNGEYVQVDVTKGFKAVVDFENVEKKVVSEYGFEGGVRIKNISQDGLIPDQVPNLKKGFVVVRVSGKPVKNTEDFKRLIQGSGNSATLEGFYPGYDGLYAYSINGLNESK